MLNGHSETRNNGINSRQLDTREELLRQIGNKVELYFLCNKCLIFSLIKLLTKFAFSC